MAFNISGFIPSFLRVRVLPVLALSLPISPGAHADIVDDLFPDYANPLKSQWRENFTISDSDFTFSMANDAIFGTTDRYFTNGMWGSWSKAVEEGDSFTLIDEQHNSRTISRAELANNPQWQSQVRLTTQGMTLGQQMYTPSNIRLRPQDADQYDRPYAGYTFVAFNTAVQSANEADHYSWALGCVGPCSGADAKQTWAHEELSPGSPKPRGWSTQVKNQPALQFSRSRYHYYDLADPLWTRLRGGTFWEMEYGTVFNRVGGGLHGALTLFGNRDCQALHFNLPNFANGLPKSNLSAPAMADVFNNSAPAGQSSAQQRRKNLASGGSADLPCRNNNHALKLYASAGAKGVLSNTLIEGGIHTDNGVIRHHAAPVFTEVKVGAHWQIGRYGSLTTSYVMRSPEVDSEGYVWNQHRWGEVSFTIRGAGLWGIPIAAGFLQSLVAYKSDEEDKD